MAQRAKALRWEVEDCTILAIANRAKGTHARHFGFSKPAAACAERKERRRSPTARLLNLPYCQRRARVSSKGLVFYGERQSKQLLRKISKATSEVDLRWAFDEHETRLPFDVQEFERLLAGRDDMSPP